MSLGPQPFDHLKGVEAHGAIAPSVKLPVALPVTGQSLTGDVSRRHGRFRHPAGRDADLVDVRGGRHGIKSLSRMACGKWHERFFRQTQRRLGFRSAHTPSAICHTLLDSFAAFHRPQFQRGPAVAFLRAHHIGPMRGIGLLDLGPLFHQKSRQQQPRAV